jgi:hypothetical protein
MYARFWWRDNEDGSANYYVAHKPSERVYVDVVLEAHDSPPAGDLTLRVWSGDAGPRAAARIVEAPELDSAGQPRRPLRYRFHFPLTRGGAWPFEVAAELVVVDSKEDAIPGPSERLEGSLTVIPRHSRTAARWLAAAGLVCWLYVLWVVNLTAADEPLLRLKANAIAVLGGVGAPLVASFRSRSRLPHLGVLLDWRWPLAALILLGGSLVVASWFPFIVWVENRTGSDLDFRQGNAPSAQRTLLFESEAGVRAQLLEKEAAYCVEGHKGHGCHYPKTSPYHHFWERLVFFPPRVAVGCHEVGVTLTGAPSITPDPACSFSDARLELETKDPSDVALTSLLRARQLTEPAALQKIRLAVPSVATLSELLTRRQPWDLNRALAPHVFLQPDRPTPELLLESDGLGIVREVRASLDGGMILTPAVIDDSGLATLHARVTRPSSPDDVSFLSCTVPAAPDEAIRILSSPQRSIPYLSDLIVIDGALTVSHWHTQKPLLTPLPLACKAAASQALLTDGRPDQVILFLGEAWYPEQRWRFEFPAPIPMQFTVYSGQNTALGTLKCNVPIGATRVEIGPVAIASTDRKPAKHLEVWQDERVADPTSTWDVADAAPAHLALWPWACIGRGVTPAGAKDGESAPAAPRVSLDGRPGKLRTDGVVFNTVVRRQCKIVLSSLQILSRSEGYSCDSDRDMPMWLQNNRGYSRPLEVCNDSSLSCRKN